MVQHLEDEIACISNQIRYLMSGYEDVLERLKETHGISEIASRDILAELGPTLEAFPSDAALASWSGLCPGNNESAGKRRSGKSPVFKHHLKTIMVEVAWAAVRTKGSYYKDKYHRLKYRIGAKKALIAVAHRILKAIYRIIKEGAHFRDLGEEYLTLRNKSKKVQRLKKQAQMLGFELVPQTA
jgi:transposase